MLTDDGVMALARSGRRDEALAAVVRQLRRKVFGLAYSYLGNRDAAEDVAQDVFIKLWRALPDYDGRAALSTWVYAITRNASLSALRARRSAASLSDPEVSAEVDSASAVAPDESGPEAEAVRRLVEQLPLKQRQVVTLFYMQEQSHEEVAAMLAMPVGTVKTLLHRARARLSEAV
ncbi:MAG TPA: sigma-70 family RNA polymerase sigma factor [Steroidobacteraceae bacterium]|nr:sigma-70 family RNA polymerase sigma factor [Steroidobacteraceae bacterium]